MSEFFAKFSNVTIFDHPLIQHKLSILRDEKTGTNQFRDLVSELAMLMAYEVLRDLPTSETDIVTPVATAKCRVVTGRTLALVPILRAGLGMVPGMLSLVPNAKVGHIGLYRDEETLEPHTYYCKLPDNIGERLVLLLDPMLATGGSACAAVDLIKKRGSRGIKFMSIIAAPEGVERLAKAHPDVQIYCGALDSHLNEHGYIVPGLGDAGDRIFGTK